MTTLTDLTIGLLNSGRYPWLSYFGTPLDERIKTQLATTISRAPAYDCYDVDSWLSDVSGLLDRCLVYRREYNDLQATAIKTALDYDLFLKNLPTSISLEKLEYIADQRKAEVDGQQLTHDAFQGAGDPLAAGFAAAATGNQTSAQKAYDGEINRTSLVEQKWQAIERYQTNLELQHSDAGNPLNFAGRAMSVAAFLLEDLGEAYDKSRSIEKGIAQVYGIDIGRQDTKLPNVNVTGVLDELVHWLRRVIRLVQLVQWKEIEFEHVVYGAQPIPKKLGPPYVLVRNLITLLASNADGILTFDLGRADYFGNTGSIENLRVKAVGVSLTDITWAPRYACIVFPPAQIDPFTPTDTVPRTPIIIENVEATPKGMRVPLSSSPSIRNVNPKGIWQVQVSRNFSLEARADVLTRPIGIQDVRLHLLLVGSPSHNISDWADFWW